MEEVIKLNAVDQYNKMFGLETLHPLVSVVDLSEATGYPRHFTLNYGVYALFLKNTKCGDIRYGKQYYDYQEGTVTSFAPGQVTEVNMLEGMQPSASGLLFHPDLIKGTSLGQGIKQYSFFSYSSTEALHLSEDEKEIFLDCLKKIKMEIQRPIDKHSKPLIVDNVKLLLDYCIRFYDRQFITRENANHDILTRFEGFLDDYFASDAPAEKGMPSVQYCADKLCLSANYFGDLLKKETGMSPLKHIQQKMLDAAKERVFDTKKSISEISCELGFPYPQHFSRWFKKMAGCTPNEYRTAN